MYAMAATDFFSCSTTRHPLRSTVDSLCRMQSFSHISSVQPSGFFLVVGAFCGFAKGAFSPFVDATLPDGLVATFLTFLLGPIGGAMDGRG
jgi:hypothetical protein